jgi:hypothetical protein
VVSVAPVVVAPVESVALVASLAAAEPVVPVEPAVELWSAEPVPPELVSTACAIPGRPPPRRPTAPKIEMANRSRRRLARVIKPRCRKIPMPFYRPRRPCGVNRGTSNSNRVHPFGTENLWQGMCRCCMNGRVFVWTCRSRGKLPDLRKDTRADVLTRTTPVAQARGPLASMPSPPLRARRSPRADPRASQRGRASRARGPPRCARVRAPPR